MFEDQMDPYETLKNHDSWIAQLSQHLETLAGNARDSAHTIESQQELIRKLIEGFNHQHRMIMNLNQRLTELERL